MITYSQILNSVPLLLVLIGLGRVIQQNSQNRTEIEKIRHDLDLHILAPNLHRNPDSEKRWERVEHTLDEVREGQADLILKLGEFLARVNNRRRSRDSRDSRE